MARGARHQRTGVTPWPARRPAKSAKAAKKAATKRPAAKPALLSGGNPQIAKGDGDAPVQAYIAAMPGWKRDVGRRLDALIVRTVPGVRKAVKWNSPFYGVEDQGWFLSFHCFTKYIKVTFFRGTSLRPLPPGESKHKEVRYLDIHEGDTRRSPTRRLGEASQPIARRTNVSAIDDDSHEESSDKREEERRERSKRRSLSLPAHRCENQGARRLARRDARAHQSASSSRPTPTWSRSGSGEAFRCGSTTASSAPARRTRRS